MRRTIVRILATAFATFALGACGGGSGGAGVTPQGPGNGEHLPSLPVIPEVASVNGVVALTLTAAFDANGRPAFFWERKNVAPTIRLRPGDTLKIHFVNALPQYCAMGVESTSNLHFHGFTSSPDAPGDDVLTTLASPKTTVDYVVHINPDQPPGLYWYHAHPHGLSSYEVGNGMAGAIVVEGIADQVPQTANLRERVIVLRDVPNSTSFAAGESSASRRPLGERRRPRDDDEGGNPCRAETDATPMINGLPMAAIGIRAGETQLFRVVNTSGHRHFDLAVDGHMLTLVAIDGVPIHTYPGAPKTITVGDVVLAPGGRAEFLVTGSSQPAALVSRCFQSGPAGDANPQIVLGALDPTAPDATTPVQTRVRAPMGLMHPLFYRTALPPPSAEHTIHFEENAQGFYLNGQAFDANAPPMVVSHTGTVELWTLQNDTDEVHVFHPHQVHFVVQSVNGVPAVNRLWRDTFDLPPQGHGAQGQIHPSLVKVLMDFRDPVIKGMFVFHCHILDHEDGGMMAKILLQ